MGSEIAQHSSLSNEHYTPAWIADLAWETMGCIDLDPASSHKANETMLADRYFVDDGKLGGLALDWHGRIFLNPPGGKLDKNTLCPLPRNALGIQSGPCFSSMAVWWTKLYTEWAASRGSQAFFVAFNMSVFRTAQSDELKKRYAPTTKVRPPFHFPMLIPRERIKFDVIDENGKRKSGKSPPQDSAIIYLPDVPRDETQFSDYTAVKRFSLLASAFGEVRC